ncbi:MAG: phosphatase PAP2 family protein [Ruminococcus sp.]|nr:phosphatase PAP2 family protein [Ruminococcus sp.]
MILKAYQNHCDSYYRQYIKIFGFFSRHKKLKAVFVIISKLLTLSVYFAYAAALAYAAVKYGLSERLLRTVAVPASAFAAVTLIRKKINAPRPYEKYPIVPLVHKSSKGNSCPSRHSACAFIIALTCCYLDPAFGAVMLIIAASVAASRPVSGVHFPLDAVFGALLSSVIGVAGFRII